MAGRVGGRVTQEPVTVWARAERGARGPTPVHSHAELATVAIELADRGGLSAVSMRRVAAGLGTGQASLYRYVSGREDLLDLMTDAVTGRSTSTSRSTAVPLPTWSPWPYGPRPSICATPGCPMSHRNRCGWGHEAWTTWNTRCGRWPPSDCRAGPRWRSSL